MRCPEINSVLESLVRLISEDRASILAANRIDVAGCHPDDEVILDRLKVDDKKVDLMIASVKSVAARPDPLGVISSIVRDDGLRIENRRVPFGTILIVYEARPDVTIEAASIAVKAGNKILLKGGKEARYTNLALGDLWRRALEENSVDVDFVRYLDISREETQALISGHREKIDLVIPRGGESLIEYVLKNSAAPVIVSGRGNNFLYIDREADFEMALSIAVDGKRRLSVCNALDKVLIDRSLPDIKARTIRLATGLRQIGIDVFGDREACMFESSITPLAGEEVWFEEFLAPKIVIGIVGGADEAIDMINKYSGGHSAAIVTENEETADRFMNEVDCAAVYHNASVRFTDGGEFGLGAEIAISTQKLHFRGPLGAEHLTTNKWFVSGDGQVRN